MSSGCFHHGLKIYYGRRRFLLTSRSYVVDRRQAPYRRLSATLLIACNKPFTLEAGQVPPITTQAALIAPKVLRKRTLAHNSDLLIFDIPLGSPEFAALAPLFPKGEVQALEAKRFSDLFSTLRKAGEDRLSCHELNQLFQDITLAVTDPPTEGWEIEQRIQQAMTWIDELPLNRIDVQALAARLGLSASRLRHLFKAQTGCSLGHYARWAGLWRAVEAWAPGKSMTDIAHEGGFHDLAHLNRAYNEILGMTPSSLVASEQVTLFRCP